MNNSVRKLDNSLEQTSSSQVRSLRMKYLGSLCLVAGVIVANVVYIKSFVHEQQKDASAAGAAAQLNVAVQKLTRHAQLLRSANSNLSESQTLLDEISLAGAKWSEDHQKLRHQVQDRPYDNFAVRTEFERMEAAFQNTHQALRKVSNGGQLLENYASTIIENEPALTLGLQNVVALIQQQSEQRASSMQNSALLLPALSLISLVFVGLFVFEPTIKTLTAQTRENIEATYRSDAQLAAIDQSQARMELTTDGTIVDGNELLLASLGYDREELLGENHHRLIPKSQQNASRHNNFWRQLASGDYRTGEFERMTKDGRIRWFQGIYMPVKNAGEVIDRVLFYGTDVTDRKAAELEKKRLDRELKTASRRARIAEVANNTLHNVGNVLNSVNVSTTLLREKIDALPVDSLAKAAVMFYEHRDNLTEFLTNDNRGKNFPGFLEAFVDHVKTQREQQKDELQALSKSVEHIKDIVSKQQSMAQASGMTEIVNPVELFEDAIKLNDTSLHSRIKFSKHFEDVPNVQTRRHDTLQVLVNFIKNACQATLEASVENMQVDLILTAEDGFISFEVRDNGIGIDSNMLEHIFENGYTTKVDGSGFGLHSCAQTAQALGGTVSAKSEGRNQGASFILRIPETQYRSARDSSGKLESGSKLG